jgi:hypothetical protein
MRMEQHAAVSAACAAGLYAIFRSWQMALSAFGAGVLIDLDHLLDVAREYGIHVPLRRFFEICHERQLKSVVLILHGWEWVALCAVGAWASGWNHWATGVFAGFALHMLLDQISNGPERWGYLFLWRWRIGFDHRRAFPLHKWRGRHQNSR